MKSPISTRQRDPSPQFLAGNLALDFLNTRVRVGKEAMDLLRSSEDVIDWLESAGVTNGKPDYRTVPLSLLRIARTLRENIRSLVETRKAGRRGDPSMLNKFLKRA